MYRICSYNANAKQGFKRTWLSGIMKPISCFTSRFVPISSSILLLESVGMHVRRGKLGRKCPDQHKAIENPACTCELLTHWRPLWLFPSDDQPVSPLSSYKLVKGIIRLCWCELDYWGCCSGGEKDLIAFVQALCLTGKAHGGISL